MHDKNNTTQAKKLNNHQPKKMQTTKCSIETTSSNRKTVLAMGFG